jgi:hypothetical protein
MSKYSTLFEKCRYRIQTFPGKNLYEEATKKWRDCREFYLPSRGDGVARERFFSAVDEACKLEIDSSQALLKCMFYASLSIGLLSIFSPQVVI